MFIHVQFSLLMELLRVMFSLRQKGCSSPSQFLCLCHLSQGLHPSSGCPSSSARWRMSRPAGRSTWRRLFLASTRNRRTSRVGRKRTVFWCFQGCQVGEGPSRATNWVPNLQVSRPSEMFVLWSKLVPIGLRDPSRESDSQPSAVDRGDRSQVVGS